MAASFHIDGNPKGPLLVCVHGLMGGPEDFNEINVPLKEHFHVALVDMNAQTKDRNNLAKVDHDSSARDIAEWIRTHHHGKRAYFFGISFGSKVIYDLIECAPEIFGGAVLTDCGPGIIQKSDFYDFITVVLPSINKNLPWPLLREELKQKVPIRNLRSLITQKLYYPDPNGPAEWRAGMLDLPELLVSQRIRDQWSVVDKMERPATILVASDKSLIAKEDLDRLLIEPNFIVKGVPDSTHFIHISHHDLIRREVMGFLDLQGPQNRVILRPGQSAAMMPSAHSVLAPEIRV